MTQFFDLFVPPASVRSSLAFNLAQTVPKPPAIVRTVCFILGACSVYGWWWPNVPGHPSENFGPMFSVVRFWRGTFRTSVLVSPSLSRYAIFFNQSSSTGESLQAFFLRCVLGCPPGHAQGLGTAGWVVRFIYVSVVFRPSCIEQAGCRL